MKLLSFVEETNGRPILFIIFAQWKKSIFCIIFWPKARDYCGQVLSDSEAVHVKNLLWEEEQLIVTLWVLKTLKILSRSLSQRRVVSVDSLLDRGVDPGVVVLVELVCVGAGVGGPGHAHRPHHVTRDVRGPDNSGLITVPTEWSILTPPSPCHCNIHTPGHTMCTADHSSLVRVPSSTACDTWSWCWFPVQLYTLHTTLCSLLCTHCTLAVQDWSWSFYLTQEDCCRQTNYF